MNFNSEVTKEEKKEKNKHDRIDFNPSERVSEIWSERMVVVVYV